MPVILTDEEYEGAKTKQGLEALLTRVCALAVEDALRLLPTVTQNLVVQISELKSASDRFYKDNPDLATQKDGVARIIQDLEARHPGKSLPDLMNEAARVAKQRLAVYGELTSSSSSSKPSLESLDYLAGAFEEK